MKNLFTQLLSTLILSICCLSVNASYVFKSNNISLVQDISQSGPRKGVINKDGVAGAISKEADDLFTQYANNNDTEGITQMLLKGQLVYLPKGTQVVLIEYGFFLHKIRTKEGQILYVARERVTLDEPDENKKQNKWQE